MSRRPLRGVAVTGAVVAIVAAAPSAGAQTPTFGNTSEGLGYYEAGTAFKRVSRFTLGASMTVIRLRAYVDGFGSGSGSQVARGVVYADATGEPGALLAVSSEVTIITLMQKIHASSARCR